MHQLKDRYHQSGSQNMTLFLLWETHIKYKGTYKLKVNEGRQIYHGNTNQKKAEGFPGGTVVESLPANAGDTGSSPGLGRSHMSRSNWAHEPQLLSLRIWSLCSATGEAAIVRGLCTAMKSEPRLPQLEKALAQKWRPNTAISKLNKKKKKESRSRYINLGPTLK